MSSDREKAYALNAFFASQTKLDTGYLSLPDLPALSFSSFCDMQTTPVEVYDVLIRLQPDKASGADEIPPKLLSLCSRGIAVSLSQLFNRSFTEYCVPQEWKDALVVPVFKSGSKSAATNY